MELNKLRSLAGINIRVPSVLSSADSNEVRRLAGLPMLPEAKDDESEESTEIEAPVTDETVADVPADAQAEETPEEESKEELISKIATHLEGKSVDEISEMLHQIYDAGFADAKKHTEDAINGTAQDEEVPNADDESADVKESLIRNAVNKFPNK